MRIPKPIQDLKEVFERLPGIGPKTAERLTFYLLPFSREELEKFANAFVGLKDVVICKVCKNVGEKDACDICSDYSRDKSKICVVQTVMDVIALEKSGYKGLYHVLHGSINPIAGIGPDEIFIKELIERLSTNNVILNLVQDPIPDQVRNDEPKGSDPKQDPKLEIILATNSDLEGEATAMYIKERIVELKNDNIKVTRIGRGLPTGADVEYADEITLRRALEGRTSV